MLILNAAEVRTALPMAQAIRAMKQAYASLSDRQVEAPLRTRLAIPAHDALSLAMPAYARTASGEALAVKVVSLFPSNPSRGLDYIQAAVLLFEPGSGRPAALLEGSSLTAIRTGAASGAAIDLLAHAECRTLAIFGAGAQGRTQLEGACTARRIDRAFIYDRNPEKAAALVKEMMGRGPIPNDVRVAAGPGEAVQEADIICTATTSSTPVFADGDIKAGVHICGVGSYTPEMQEIPAETMKRARVVVDSREAALEEAGDLLRPIRAGSFDESHIHAELGEIVLGRKAGRQSEEEITCFKSVGLAVQDAVAAQLAFENASGMKLGTEIEF